MHSAELAAINIIALIDTKIWDVLAVKAIEKMMPTHETNSSLKIINDFTVLLANKNKKKEESIQEVRDHADTFKENYILGTTKILEGKTRSVSCKI